MKEIPKRYTNPFLSDEENEKVNLWNQELEPSNIEGDLTNNCEDDKLINSLAASELCEKETDLYTIINVMECGLPESLLCYKEGALHVKDICVDEGMPHGERFLLDENNNVTLKPELLTFSTMEDYLMESNLCSEINGNIDTGLPVVEPSNDLVDIEDDHDEVIEKKGDAPSETQGLDADLPAHEPINDQSNMGCVGINTQIQVQDLHNSIPDFKECGTNEEALGSIVPNELKEMSKADNSNGDELSSQSDTGSKAIDNNGPDIQPNEEHNSNGDELSSQSDTGSKAIDNNGPDISLQPNEEQINSSGIPSSQQDRPLPSLKSLLESIDQQPFQSPVEKNSESSIENKSATEGNTTLNLNNTEPANRVHNNKNVEHVNELPTEPHGAPKLQDVGADNIPAVNPMHHGGEGESTFSVVGPISGLVTYSGPIAFSGSTSLRSDSSTTSTRSFAFPILQNEWNSSPVRMKKADRRLLSKHRGWRHGLLCCRF